MHTTLPFFLSLLKNEFTEPVGAPNFAQFRLVDMYTSVTRKSVQESIVASFSTGDSPISNCNMYNCIWHGDRLC